MFMDTYLIGKELQPHIPEWHDDMWIIRYALTKCDPTNFPKRNPRLPNPAPQKLIASPRGWAFLDDDDAAHAGIRAIRQPRRLLFRSVYWRL